MFFSLLYAFSEMWMIVFDATNNVKPLPGWVLLTECGRKVKQWEIRQVFWPMSFDNLFQKAFSYLCPALAPPFV